MTDIELKTLWRVSDYIDLNGDGGRKASARWHTAGSRVVYLADSSMMLLLKHSCILKSTLKIPQIFTHCSRFPSPMDLQFYRLILPPGLIGSKT